DAAVFTAAVGVQAESKPDVRAVVLGEDRPARVAVEDGRECSRTEGIVAVIGVEFDVQRLVAVRRIVRRPAAGKVGTGHVAEDCGLARRLLQAEGDRRPLLPRLLVESDETVAAPADDGKPGARADDRRPPMRYRDWVP